MQALDRRLTTRFAAAVARLTETGAEAALKDLRGIQLLGGGSRSIATCNRRIRLSTFTIGRTPVGRTIDRTACTADAYLRREGELVALYGLERPSEVLTWTCDGGAAAPVTTHIFQTETPSMRIEYRRRGRRIAVWFHCGFGCALCWPLLFDLAVEGFVLEPNEFSGSEGIARRCSPGTRKRAP